MQCNILKNIIDNIKIIKNIIKNNINDIINDFLANLNWTPYINLNLNLYITSCLSVIYISLHVCQEFIYQQNISIIIGNEIGN